MVFKPFPVVREKGLEPPRREAPVTNQLLGFSLFLFR
ncbi:MAG: hypothetical protein JWP94_2209 [Mucilaginibacter sp.]|nr:hypothetical protein [Mucilaginibacter sp.]